MMRSIVLLTFFVLFTGCAAVPEDKFLVIESSPLGVNVTSKEGWTCVTPCERRVGYGSTLNLMLSEANYKSTTVEVDIPPFEPSRVATYIGAGVGAATMALGADFVDTFNSALIKALTGSEEDFLTSGEKLLTSLAGGIIGGAIGYSVDRARDKRKMQERLRIHVKMIEEGVTE